MHQTHEVGVHLQSDFLFSGKLQRSANAHACIVDQNINPTFFLDHLCDGIRHCVAITDINMEIVHLRQRLHLTTHGTINGMAFLCKQPSRFEAEA